MKKSVIIGLGILLIVVFVGGYFQLTGNVVQGPPGGGGPEGPSAEDMDCMVRCTTQGCDVDDIECRTAKSGECGSQCGVDVSGPPEPKDEGEACMQECIVKGCEKFDVSCQNANMDKCEDDCDMKGDAPDESEMDAEQLCISNCVASKDPDMICGNSKEGETGGGLCQTCANECVHLYEGPCLNDEQVTEKENECISKCEHCYGGPIEGPSGQGWDCIVDIKCEDASAEFGDDAGTGDASFEEGHEGPGIVAGIVEGVGNAVSGVVDFFKGIFGGRGE